MRILGFTATVLVGFGICTAEATEPNSGGKLQSVGYAIENGDTNGDLDRDLSDAVYTLGYLFLGGPEPVPLAYCAGEIPAVENGDVNGDGSLDVSDATRMLAWLFAGGPAPESPCGDGSGGARNLNPRVIPPHAKAHGKECGEWSTLWWQWAYSFPADMNPVGDTTGEFAALGQSGSVWFLAGTFGGAVERNVTIPTGKTLFFPIVNSVWVNVPEFGDDPWSDEQEAFARALLHDHIDSMMGLSCQIDGQDVQSLENYRCVTPEDGEYMIDFPENNVWGIPAGTYGPSVDDGLFLTVAPLSAGEHTIHFTASNADGSWGVDATYNLTVE